MKKSEVSHVIILEFVLFLVLSLSTVNAIKCFQCNSNNNSACTNLELIGKNPLYPTPCVGDYNGQEPFCRKVVVQIMDPEQEYAPRTVRSCGWIRYKAPCYTANNNDHDEKVCQCFEDGCNGAQMNAILNLSAILLPGMIAIKSYFSLSI